LWVNSNPSTFGAANAPTPSVGDIGAGGVDFAPIVGFAFRTSGGPSLSYADEMRVGLAWADVTPPAVETPTLAIAFNGNGSVTLSWPTVATGFNLESATNLNSPIGWASVNDPVTVVGTNKTVTVNSASGNQFFRLRK
jgi:hypothetical protein